MQKSVLPKEHVFLVKSDAAGRSLGKVDVGEDVILAEAVIARALAAIAELEFGVIRVRAAADGALVVVALLLLLLLLRLFLQYLLQLLAQPLLPAL